MQYLKQSTAATIKMGPFVDSTDGVTAETGLSILAADVKISKNGGTIAAKNDANNAVHDAEGYYTANLDATDTGTVGRLRVLVNESGALPVWQDFMVVPANVYDSMMGTDRLTVDVEEIGNDIITAAAIANGAIDSATFAAGAINAAAIADGAIDAATFAAGAINAAAIATDAIDNDALAANAVSEIQSGLSTLTAQQVWEYGTRTLSSYGTLVSDIATAVWGAGTRTLSSFGTLVADVWAALTSGLTGVGTVGKLIVDNVDAAISSRLASAGYTAPDNASITAIKNKTDNLPASPAAVGSAMTLANGSITAAVIATDAIDADAIAADAVSEIKSGLATMAAVQAVETKVDTVDSVVDAIKLKTDNIPASPAAVGDAMTLATGAITAAVIATDAIDNDAIAANAITEIQNGLATAAALTTVEGKIDTVDGVADAIKTKTDSLTFTTPGKVDATATVDTSGLATAAALTTVEGKVDSIQADTNDIQTRLPAALVDGKMSASATVDTTGLATSAEIAALDVVVDRVEADTQDIQSRLPAALVGGKMDANATATVDSAAVADAVWDEVLGGHSTAGTAGKTLTDLGAGTGSGAVDWVHTVTVNAAAKSNALVEYYTDSTRETLAARGLTNTYGQVTFSLTAGKYYVKIVVDGVVTLDEENVA